jgi:hypothetical protein
MRIQSYQTNIPNKTNTGFTSIYYNGNKYRYMYCVKRETQNSTCKRNDLNYNKLAKIIPNRFKEFDRINIMPMNVSDGTEIYYISKPLIEEMGFEEFERKCSPIYATDVCRDIIETYPQKNLVHLYKGEPEELSIYRKPMFREVSPSLANDKFIDQVLAAPLYELKPEYRKHFKFGVQDFQKRLANLQDEGNSVAIIRNCLRQSFGDFRSALIVDNLAQKLKGASLFITGDYDRGMPLFESALRDYFEEIDHNVWAKRGYKPAEKIVEKPQYTWFVSRLFKAK